MGFLIQAAVLAKAQRRKGRKMTKPYACARILRLGFSIYFSKTIRRT
jgi:hypothetical protein